MNDIEWLKLICFTAISGGAFVAWTHAWIAGKFRYEYMHIKANHAKSAIHHIWLVILVFIATIVPIPGYFMYNKQGGEVDSTLLGMRFDSISGLYYTAAILTYAWILFFWRMWMWMTYFLTFLILAASFSIMGVAISQSVITTYVTFGIAGLLWLCLLVNSAYIGTNLGADYKPKHIAGNSSAKKEK